MKRYIKSSVSSLEKIQDQIFGMLDTTDYELVDYGEDETWFDFLVPDDATEADTQQFVSSVAKATNAIYDISQRHGRVFPIWILHTPDGIELAVGYSPMVDGLWHIVIKDN